MSPENKDIVEKVNASFAENNPEGFLAACADDVEWNMVGDTSTKGKDAIRKFMSSMEGMEPPRFTVDEIIAEGDSVVCYGDMTMKNKDGNAEDYSYVDAYRFRKGQIIKLQSFIVKHKIDAEKKESSGWLDFGLDMRRSHGVAKPLRKYRQFWEHSFDRPDEYLKELSMTEKKR